MALTDSQLRRLEELELQESGQNPTEVYGEPAKQFDIDNLQPVTKERQNLERRIPISQEPSRTTGIIENPEALEDPNMIQRGLETVSENFSKSAVGAFARGANDVILALPDLVINAIGSSVNYLGLTEDEWDKNKLSRIFNSDDYESQKVILPYLVNYGIGNFVGQGESEGEIDKYARIGGQGAGMAVPFIGASGRAAQTTTNAVTRIADKTGAKFNPLTQAGRKTTDPYTAGQLADDIGYQMLTTARATPATAAAVEATAGAVSTMGMQGELDIFGTQTGVGGLLPLASIPAFALYSGTKYVGSKLPSKTIYDYASNLRASKKLQSGELTAEQIAATKSGQKQQGEISSQIGERLQTPESETALARTQEIDQDIPLDLTVAEQSLDPTLVATQQRILDDASKSSSPSDLNFIDQQVFRVEQNTRNIKRFQENIIEDPLTDSPSIVVDAATGKRESLLKRIKDGEAKVTDSVNALKEPTTGALPVVESRAPIGQSIRTALEEGLQNAKDAATQLANKLKINDKDNIGSLDAVYNAREQLAKSVLAKTSFADYKNAKAARKSGESFTPQGLKGGLVLGEGDKTIDPFIMSFINGPNETLSFQNWRRLLDQTGDLLGKAINNNAKTKIKDYSMMKEVLLGMGDNYGKLNSNFKLFQENYKKTVIEPFQTDVVYKVLNKQKVDDYILPDEKVASAFAGDSTSAKNFMEYFKDSPQMFNNMESIVLDEVRRRAWSEGNGALGADKISSYLNTNRETLQVLKNADGVSLYDTLSDSRNLIGKLLTRQKTLATRRKAIESNLLMKKIAKAEMDGEPELIFNEAIKTPSVMKKLKQIASRGENSEGTLQAFRATIMQKLMSQSPDMMTDPGKFKDFLQRRATVLKEAFEPNHIMNLYIAADAAERAGIAVPTAGELGRSTDALSRLSKALGTSLPSVSSMARSVAESRMSGQHAITMVSTRALSSFNNAKQQALLREAIFNPKLAELINTRIPVGATSLPPALNKKINAYLFNTGDTYGDNPVEYYYPDRPLATFPETGQDFSVDSETNRVIEETQPSIDPRNIDPIPAPPPPSMDLTQVAPPPNPASTGGGQMDIASLFPFDTTSAAIQKRQQQKQGQGLGSLMT
tara:strand:+ start:2231 stop:5587 length:3357 start_codon:yes stop_codon:yes gene_type:complete